MISRAFPILAMAFMSWGAYAGSSAETAQWQTQGFTNTEIRTVGESEVYPNGTQGLTHRIDIDAVVLRGTRWAGTDMVERYRRVAAALASCQVKISQLRLITTDPLDGTTDYVTGDDTGYRTDTDNIYYTANAVDPISNGRTTVFYIRWIETGGGYTTVPSCTQEPYSVVFNKHWIPESSLDLSNNGISALYTSESHEIGHNLIRWPEFDHLCQADDFISSEERRVREASLSQAERDRRAAARERRSNVRISRQHVTGEERNVMQDFPYYLNNQFNADQCRRIRQHPLVRPL